MVFTRRQDRMKRFVSVLVLMVLLFIFASVSSFSEEVSDVVLSVPWSGWYSTVSAVDEGFKVVYLEGRGNLDLYIIPIQVREGHVPEIWHMGLSMKKGDSLSMGFSWSGEFSEGETKGPRDESVIERSIPWGTYEAMAWKENNEMPSSLHWDILYQPEPDLVAEAGLSYTRWSRYDGDENSGLSSGRDALKDTLGMHFGLIYNLNKTMNIQAGYIFAPSPLEGTSSFSGYSPYDRHILRFGTGFRRGELDLRLSYMFLLYENSGQHTGSSASDPFLDEEDDKHLELKVRYRF